MNETFMKERPVLPLILSMSLPMVISMLVNSLYNIVDSFFVAKISEDAMTALSLVYPVQNFINALSIGFGVGINAVIAFYLGAGDGTFLHSQKRIFYISVAGLYLYSFFEISTSRLFAMRFFTSNSPKSSLFTPFSCPAALENRDVISTMPSHPLPGTLSLKLTVFYSSVCYCVKKCNRRTNICFARPLFQLLWLLIYITD